MVEAIENFFLETVGRRLCVFFCAMLPIIECRGSVPLGCSLGMPWYETLFFSVLGNLLPVPFILLFIKAILRFLTDSRVKLFSSFGHWLEEKVEKHKGSIEKYSYLGVLLFVAVPIPGTGAWTGSLIASVLGLKPQKSFLAAVGGVLVASLVMTLLSYAVKGII